MSWMIDSSSWSFMRVVLRGEGVDDALDEVGPLGLVDRREAEVGGDRRSEAEHEGEAGGRGRRNVGRKLATLLGSVDEGGHHRFSTADGGGEDIGKLRIAAGREEGLQEERALV